MNYIDFFNCFKKRKREENDNNYNKNYNKNYLEQQKHEENLYKIKANIRNLGTLSDKDKDYILNDTNDEEKFQLIVLYSECYRIIISNMDYFLNYNAMSQNANKTPRKHDRRVVPTNDSPNNDTPPLSIPNSLRSVDQGEDMMHSSRVGGTYGSPSPPPFPTKSVFKKS